MRSRVSEVFRDQGESGTAQVRRVIWSGGLESFRERPLAGWGPGSFQIVFPRYRDPRYSILGVSHNTLHAHANTSRYWGDIGIAGLSSGGCSGVHARRMKGAGL
jgi:O-antigen ligase